MTRNELVEKVIQAILDEPDQMDMGDWVCSTLRNICGTTACFAGFTCMIADRLTGRELLQHRRNTVGYVEHRAMQLLELDSDTIQNLFHVRSWPMEWYRKLNETRAGTPEYARVVADYAREFFGLPEQAENLGEPIGQIELVDNRELVEVKRKSNESKSTY